MMIRSHPDLYNRKYRFYPLDRGTYITTDGDWRQILAIRVVEEARTQNIRILLISNSRNYLKVKKSTWNQGITVSGFGV